MKETEEEKHEAELPELGEGAVKFPQVSVIVEPPSPDRNEQLRNERVVKMGDVQIQIDTGYDLRHLLKSERLSQSDAASSNNSSNSNLLSKSIVNFQLSLFFSCSGPCFALRSGTLSTCCYARCFVCLRETVRFYEDFTRLCLTPDQAFTIPKAFALIVDDETSQFSRS